MLLNFDDQQLRSSLALWKEAMAVGQPASRGQSASDRARVLSRLDDTVTGCLAVLQACTAVDDASALDGLLAELKALRQWVNEGRLALNMVIVGQR